MRLFFLLSVIKTIPLHRILAFLKSMGHNVENGSSSQKNIIAPRFIYQIPPNIDVT